MRRPARPRSGTIRRRRGSRRRRACSTAPTPSRSRIPRNAAKTLHFGGLEFAPLAGLEPFERQVRVAGAVQRLHAIADGLEHALDLAVAPFVDRQLDRRARQTPDLRRSCPPVLEVDTLGELPQRAVARLLPQLDDV